MRKMLLAVNVVLAISSSAQDSAAIVNQRTAKIKDRLQQREAEAKQRTKTAKSASRDVVQKYASQRSKLTQGNCSSFVQPGGAITSLDQRRIIIDAPGYYYFTENVQWNPNHCPNNEAILILADDVILDLRGYTLGVNYADTNRQFTGISIVASNNVTIKNGTISGMTYYGVEAEVSTNVTIENVTVSNMKYYNVNKADTSVTPCGIIMSAVNTFTIKNSKVYNINTTSSSCAGIQVVLSKNGRVLNDTISDLKNYDGSVQGFSYIESDSINTSYCHSSSFQSYYQGLTSTLGHTVLGFIPTLCHFLNYESCSAINMIGSCDDCHGMSVFLDSAVTVNNFTAKRIVDGYFPYNTGAKATGLEVYGYAVTVTNSMVDSIISIVPQDLQATGFSAWGNNITFNNCIARNVKVQNAQFLPDTTKGFGTGFGWAPDPRTEFDTVTANNVSYINCIADDCQLGFDTWCHTNSTWSGYQTPNCEKSVLVLPQTAQRTLTFNVCSEWLPKYGSQTVVLTNKAVNSSNSFSPPLSSAKKKK